MAAAFASRHCWTPPQRAAHSASSNASGRSRSVTCNRGGQACCSSRAPNAGAPAAPAAGDKTGTAAASAMPGSHPSAASWTLLQDFTQKQFRGQAQQYTSSCASRSQVKEALLMAYSQPYPPAGWSPPPSGMVLLGVMASEARLAVRALRDYCKALGLTYIQPECKVPGVASLMAVSGGVYVKYNSASQVCYLSRYEGRDRGVLVQLGDLQFGHFPLGMFDEAMASPPPVLE